MSQTQEDSQSKSREQRAEDVAYTINHAFACTATDLASPYVTHTILSKLFHKHSHVGDWFVSEGVGDFAAVPVTIAIETHAPRFVNGLRKVMESTLGWAFRKSAKREAHAWAVRHALRSDSAESKDKEQQIYHYEIDHLPQAMVWTATSFIFNIATEQLFHEHLHKGHDHGHQPLWAAAGALLGGKLFSTALVVGTRAGFPDKAHQWDSFAARKVFAPATKTVSRLFGVDTRAVERMERQQEEAEGTSWEQRVAADSDGVGLKR